MHCVQFESRLNDLLDERRSPRGDRPLMAHARRCPECANLLAGHETLVEGLQSLASSAPDAGLATLKAPVDFSLRVALAVDRERKNRRTVWGWVSAAIAASLLVGVAVWRMSAGGDKPGAQQVVDNIQRPAQGQAGGPALGPPSLSFSGISWSDMQTDRISQSLSSGVGQLADGLKPVTNSMSGALEALRRTLPGREQGTRSSSVLAAPDVVG